MTDEARHAADAEAKLLAAEDEVSSWLSRPGRPTRSDLESLRRLLHAARCHFSVACGGNAPGIGNQDGTGSLSRTIDIDRDLRARRSRRVLEIDRQMLDMEDRMVDSIARRHGR